jgi:hypothetical protein
MALKKPRRNDVNFGSSCLAPEDIAEIRRCS